jgi:ethanolamine utilization protein EutA
MGETLLSVGLDVGTTSTQLVVSELTVENQASAFSVPEMTISRRKLLYESPVYFTPLSGEQQVDGQGIREILEREYRAAGITRDMVDTGAVIITGETSRKENARIVLDALAEYAGDFVVATAGPDLESVLAAKGAGAVAFSADTGKSVLHMDIGGGTSNLAWIEDGKIVKTGCLNVGGRLIKVGERGEISYISPALEGICGLKVGDRPPESALFSVAEVLAQALEMAAGLREPTALLEKLWTQEAGGVKEMASGGCVISFSGGVADCIEKDMPWRKYGDIGPLLGRAIRESRLCAGEYRLGEQTIRATVIGAGSHSAQLSGSTVFYRDVDFPLKNLPVVRLSEEATSEEIRRKLASQDTESVVAMAGFSGSYRRVKALAEDLAAVFAGGRILLAVEADMAKALGQALALNTEKPVLCIDRVRLQDGDYLDVGAPVGPALPVVVKTLVLKR